MLYFPSGQGDAGDAGDMGEPGPQGQKVSASNSVPP